MTPWSTEQTIAASQPSPPECSARAAEHKRLTDALRGAAADHQRVPLVLFHFDQMSYQDIATRSACPREGEDGHPSRPRSARAAAGLTSTHMTDRFQELEQPDKFYELEELVGRRLKQLPAPRAPRDAGAGRAARGPRRARGPRPPAGRTGRSPGKRVGGRAGRRSCSASSRSGRRSTGRSRSPGHAYGRGRRPAAQPSRTASLRS